MKAFLMIILAWPGHGTKQDYFEFKSMSECQKEREKVQIKIPDSAEN